MSLSDVSISYDWDSSDFSSGQTITQAWAQASNNPAIPSGIQIPINSTNVFTPPILAGSAGFAYLLAYQVASMMKISFTRMYNAKLTPTFASNGTTVTNIHFDATINNIVSKNNALPNDNISALCAGNWWVAMANSKNFNTAMPTCTTPNVIATFTSDIPNKFEHATNVVDRFIPMNNSDINLAKHLIENATNVTLTVLPSNSNQSPTFIADYIFQYSFLISFIGAAFFGISSIVSFDPTTIIANKNISVVLNVLIGLAGFIALCVWYNMNVPVLDGSVINSKSVKSVNK